MIQSKQFMHAIKSFVATVRCLILQIDGEIITITNVEALLVKNVVFC